MLKNLLNIMVISLFGLVGSFSLAGVNEVISTIDNGFIDGTYQVTCIDGTVEEVTYQQLANGNVCKSAETAPGPMYWDWEQGE